jgi:hypothetical protein
MSTDPSQNTSDELERDEDYKAPFDPLLATLGKKMRVYGNTVLVLMIVMFFISLLVFSIVFNPIMIALTVIYLLRLIELIFFADYLSSLKKAVNTYGGHYLNKAYYLFLGMLGLNLSIMLLGSIFAIMHADTLNTTFFGSDLAIKRIFFYYTLLSEAAPWIRFIELLIPILNIIGSLMLFKWGTLYVGERMDEEIYAPFPNEMRRMVIGFGIMFSGAIIAAAGFTLYEFLIDSEILLFLGIFGNLLTVIGSIVTSVGYSKAGYYLELYTTKDKEKFFSSKNYDD